jgi:hypothetical protein
MIQVYQNFGLQSRPPAEIDRVYHFFWIGARAEKTLLATLMASTPMLAATCW